MTARAPIIPENMKILVEERIHDNGLRGNIRRATHTSLGKRAVVVEDFPQWEEMRSTAHDVKKHVIEHLGHYLRQFEQHAVEAGAEVHFVHDAAEATELVSRLASERGESVIVKSKSMTTEEMNLNAALEERGMRVLETDLGEYIVQLAEEPPSHITAPALHKSRGEIGHLFAEHLDIPYTDDPEELTGIARRVLREEFLRADVGISGVNFALADSGTICIVENEGNARLSTSLPKVHIAVMGIEKLLPDTETLGLFLNMLGRSATGQRITCYTSLFTGPRRSGEADGPEELHIVLLDNGRSTLHADPVLREALYCIRCGACMNVCPVYQKIGGHGYGSVYSGPIGSVVTPVFMGQGEARELPYASSLCGACADICPVQIDLHHHLLEWRRRMTVQQKRPVIERIAMRLFAFFSSSAMRFDTAGRLARLFAPLMTHPAGGLRIPVWSKTREFPELPRKTFKQMWKEERERT